MGVLPLVLSTGAGAEMRHAMGVAVFAGMLGVTAFGLFLTPVFYVLLRRMTGNRPLKHYGEVAHAAPVTGGQGHHTPAPVKAPALADERG
jgi:multidrug efflux pump